MRLCVVIPAHAPWHVVELTLGSFLRTHQTYEIDVHVGVHANFCHYTSDYQMFKDLRGIAQIHMVEEIDWGAHNESMFRYSTMHAKNLENLLRHAAYYDFDRLVILDHDLFVKRPFVSECLLRFPEADLVGSAFDDLTELREFKTENGQFLYALPKISVWHVILTRKLFDKIMADPRVIYPRMLSDEERMRYFPFYETPKDLPVFVDTFADVFHKTRFIWDLKHELVPTPEFDAWVQHYSGSSFNYGFRILGSERYNGRMVASQDLFKKEFPYGLEPYRARKRSMFLGELINMKVTTPVTPE